MSSIPSPKPSPHFGDSSSAVQTSGPFESVATPNRTQEGTGSLDVDADLVQQTKAQIRGLVNEIAQLCQSDLGLDEFYDGFMTRVISALASTGGGFWVVDDQQRVELVYQVNWAATGLSDNEDARSRHLLLIEKVRATGKPTLAPPQSGLSDPDEPGNPTESLLVLAPVVIDGETRAVVEAFQRPGGGPTTQRGYLRFLTQMCDLAAGFLKDRRLRDFDQRQALWRSLEQFIRAVHRSLDPQETAYTIVNDGRRLIEADRVSVALMQGRKCDVQAVSGLDSIDRRASDIKHLNRLATIVASGKEPFWYEGDDHDLPPQVENALGKYVDRSHAKMMAVLPLVSSSKTDEATDHRKRNVVGVLIVEQLQDSHIDASLKQRVEIVAEHSGDALSNARSHSDLFLLPLWQAIGRSKAIVAARNLPKTLLALAVFASLLASLFFIPADFAPSASGTLRPTKRHEVFAPLNGKLIDVLAPEDPQEYVEVGQPLAQLENDDLAEKIATLEGRRREAEERVVSLKQMQLDNDLKLSLLDESRLDGEIQQLLVSRDSLNRQIALLERKQQELMITSPARGQVVTWQVRDKLKHRPVDRGQRIMTVVDPTGPWELELLLPERRVRHLRAAQDQLGEDLRVSFVLATHPDREFEGRVVEIGQTAEVREEEGNVVLVRVAINKAELPDLRVGAKLTAQVQCGRRSLGYVLFHDLFETVHSKWIQWF